MTFFGVIPSCYRQVVILLAHAWGRTASGFARYNTFGSGKEWLRLNPDLFGIRTSRGAASCWQNINIVF
jgi:hypothetical protein